MPRQPARSLCEMRRDAVLIRGPSRGRASTGVHSMSSSSAIASQCLRFAVSGGNDNGNPMCLSNPTLLVICRREDCAPQSRAWRKSACITLMCSFSSVLATRARFVALLCGTTSRLGRVFAHIRVATCQSAEDGLACCCCRLACFSSVLGRKLSPRRPRHPHSSRHSSRHSSSLPSSLPSRGGFKGNP